MFFIKMKLINFFIQKLWRVNEIAKVKENEQLSELEKKKML